MNSKEMKSIRKPCYAVSLCKGLFAGAQWQCRYCGRRATTNGGLPVNFGRCPDTNSGNHVWEEC